ERKDLQAEELGRVQEDIDRLAREAASEQADAARALREAAAAIRERRIGDKIEYARDLVRPGGPLDLSRRIEEMISEDLRDLERRLDAATRALTDGPGDNDTRTLDEARDLARALDSMEERLRQQRAEERARRAGDRTDGGAERDAAGERGAAGAGASGGQTPRDGPAGRPTGEDGEDGEPPDRVAGASAAGGPGAIPPGMARQLQREAAERRREAEGLRRRLIEEGRTEDARTLGDMIAGLQALASGAPFRDVDHAARLQEDIATGARRLELSLRRQILGERAARSVITGTGEVPDEYRELVERYFRSLSGDRQR
ncbi:MAG TPA: hypothetical protein VML95_04045, partial [Longimicrobiales bacterium]|nr:hypothetical protein [Longimicrobiales bacterium]